MKNADVGDLLRDNWRAFWWQIGWPGRKLK